MAKATPTKLRPARPAATPPPRRRWAGWRVLLHLLGIVAIVGGLGYLTTVVRQYVDQEVAGPTGPLRVVLANKPVWMTDYLAQQIAATVPHGSGSAFDHDLLVSAVERLRSNPWVSNVRQVRRVYGNQPGDTLEVDCEYRAPIALVAWGAYYWLVDNDGYKLPEQFSADQLEKIVRGRDGRVNLRVVRGVRNAPPETGHRWSGPDLSAGLDLVKLLYAKAYLEEVIGVDVTNYDGRVDRGAAQLVLETSHGTQVLWGQPVHPKDFFVEVSVNQKLATLRAVVRQFGRIDAGKPWLDVRFDASLAPETPAPGQPAVGDTTAGTNGDR